MAVTTELVKELRERTGAGIKECKDVLTQVDGNLNKAIEVLRERGIEAAAKKQSREAREGRVETYVHPGARLAAMVELNCETDFVARTEDFIAFSHDLAIHIAATNPRYLSSDEVPEEEITDSGLTPDDFYEQFVLLMQPFVKDGRTIIQDMIKERIAKIGENIVIRRFARFEVGE